MSCVIFFASNGTLATEKLTRTFLLRGGGGGSCPFACCRLGVLEIFGSETKVHCSAGTSWGYGLEAYGTAIFQSPRSMYARPKFRGTSLKFRRTSSLSRAIFCLSNI